MEQRSLRLGDVIDDYCPRERRVTNHVIAVLVDDVIHQTRCNTCDVEHDYKEAKVPRKKLKGESDLAGGILVPHKPVNGTTIEPAPEPMVLAPEPAASSAATSDPEPNGNTVDAPPDAWLAHRPLIRAALPKTDEPPPPRPIPEFTMHQRQGRGFVGRGFRPGGGHGGHGGHGGGHGFAGHNGGRTPPNRETNGNEPDGNRPSQPGGGGGKGRHRRRRRR